MNGRELFGAGVRIIGLMVVLHGLYSLFYLALVLAKIAPLGGREPLAFLIGGLAFLVAGAALIFGAPRFIRIAYRTDPGDPKP